MLPKLILPLIQFVHSPTWQGNNQSSTYFSSSITWNFPLHISGWSLQLFLFFFFPFYLWLPSHLNLKSNPSFSLMNMGHNFLRLVKPFRYYTELQPCTAQIVILVFASKPHHKCFIHIQSASAIYIRSCTQIQYIVCFSWGLSSILGAYVLLELNLPNATDLMR